MYYHGDLYLYNVCLGSNKNILLLLLYHSSHGHLDRQRPLSSFVCITC